jgi:hypothetical protein
MRSDSGIYVYTLDSLFRDIRRQFLDSQIPETEWNNFEEYLFTKSSSLRSVEYNEWVQRSRLTKRKTAEDAHFGEDCSSSAISPVKTSTSGNCTMTKKIKSEDYSHYNFNVGIAMDTVSKLLKVYFKDGFILDIKERLISSLGGSDANVNLDVIGDSLYKCLKGNSFLSKHFCRKISEDFLKSMAKND